MFSFGEKTVNATNIELPEYNKERFNELMAKYITENTLGERIKTVRLYYNLTQEQLANNLGVSRNFLSQVENNKSKASIEMAIGASNSMKVINIHWLLSGIGNPLVTTYGEDNPSPSIEPAAVVFILDMFKSDNNYKWYDNLSTVSEKKKLCYIFIQFIVIV